MNTVLNEKPNYFFLLTVKSPLTKIKGRDILPSFFMTSLLDTYLWDMAAVVVVVGADTCLPSHVVSTSEILCESHLPTKPQVSTW